MGIFRLCPETLGILSAVIGVGVSNGLDDNQQNVLGNFLVSTGSIILTIAAQADAIDDSQSDKERVALEKRVNDLEEQIQSIYDSLNKPNP